MKKYESCARFLPWFMALVLSVLLAACGGGRDPILGSGDVSLVGGVPPTVTAVAPLNNATLVPTNTRVIATFSEAINPASITSTSFTLKQGETAVAGTTSYSGVNAVFTPAIALANSTTYTATITTGAKDLAGNAMASNYIWSWTTGAVSDTIPPTVSGTINANGAVNVTTNTKVGATFSEGMDPLSFTATSFTLKQGATAVTGTVSYSGVNAVFTPTSLLANSTVYTATITTVAKDLAGNALADNYVWSWTTGVAADTTAPTITGTINGNGATNVATNTKVGATFSEAMDPLSINATSFTLKNGATPVVGTTSYSGRNAVFTPTNVLAANTLYTATITTGAKDLAGNAMVKNHVWSWTTGAAADTDPPTVTLVAPAIGATNVSIKSAVAATFSEAMDPLSISTATFAVVGITGTVDFDAVGKIATFTPSAALAKNTTYTAIVKSGINGVKDAAENAMVSDKVWAFTTGAGPAVVINLGRLATFGIAATAGVTNTTTSPLTTINGDVALHPVSGATCNGVAIDAAGGFGPCGSNASTPIINGTVVSPLYPDAGVTSGAIKDDLLAAYLSITPPAGPPAAGSLGGATSIPAGTTLGALTGSALVQGDNLFTPGVYRSITSILITDDLTLDAQGNPDAIFVFQSSSTVGTADGSVGTHPRILLINGAKASNVYWQAATSATLGTSSEWQGNLLAGASITMKTGANSCGRLLAGAFTAGAFVFDSNVVNVPGNANSPASCK